MVSNDDINRLESKIKELEGSILTAKLKGQEKKLDKLEEQLKMTDSYIYVEHESQLREAEDVLLTNDHDH